MYTTRIPAAALALTLVAAPVTLAQNRIDTQLPDAPELANYGDLPVGVQELSFVNPDQINILAIDPTAPKPETWPLYDRPLTVEMWYPAAEGQTGETALKVFLRDAKTEVTIEGRALRDAAVAAPDTPYPLVIISHGYPGNRFLLSHLAENLASKGYVVASIDHTDSTYRTQAAFGSTLVNRSLDQLFVLEELAKLSADGAAFDGLYDAGNTGLIGYSMGGYGAIITAGGGVTETSVGYPWGGPHGTLGIHQAGSETHNALPDARIKTAVAFGPWGMNTGFWDAQGLAGVQIPMLFIAGSQDDVSQYETGIRAIWDNVTGVETALLTYANAGHNAGAPMPAPAESYRFAADLGFNVSSHYSDPVWESARMNNIAQHFVTAWMNHYLKDDASASGYLDLVTNSNDGIWSVADDGTKNDDHTYWTGFPEGTAKGLMYEVKTPGN
ncbi:MAG: dienelactone hydrolase [Pseudomonadota bacterium]